MPKQQDIALIAHLMRRAGFGAPYHELQARGTNGFEATVEELLHPEDQPDVDLDLLLRYYTEAKIMAGTDDAQEYWSYRMIASPRPLQEKMALFWHGVFCTGNAKCDHARQIQVQVDKFRRYGMGSFRDLLLQLASDPAMIFYLDNCMSHKEAINENWGRELLELFSMGVGNYTEDDVKVCSRAFTGWTITNPIPNYPYSRYEAQFIYNPQDHDNNKKTFLGETGRFNGEDVIDIICRQPATARFIGRHLYNFFVADEPQVAAWLNTPPQGPDAIGILEDEYFRSHYDLTSMLRVLFNSDFFKNARFRKVKSPTETVVGTMRLVGGFIYPKLGLARITQEIRLMGQDLINPPTVEGWHTGKEWIDSGTLVERINFTAEQVGNIQQPGVRAIVERLALEEQRISPELLLDRCLEMLGCYELGEVTRGLLVTHARKGGPLSPGTEEFEHRVGQMLQLIVATQESQFA